MDNFDEILDQALEMMQKGHSKQEVLLKFADYEPELSPLLDISASLLHMPKNIQPQPSMQRKYVFASAKSVWLSWLDVSKFAGVSMSILLLISAFVATGYAAFNSGPGQALFAVKKSAEQARVLLAYNQEDKANLQVAIAQQRLNEAQQIFNDPNSDQDQKEAALNELTQQTSQAIADVSTVTQSDPKSQNSKPLVSSLEKISQQQQNLLAEAKSDKQIKAIADTALETAAADNAKISQIKQQVAIANSSQTLTQLTSDPNSVAILGNVTQISDSKITVEKTTFSITAQTSIKNTDGANISLSQVTTDSKVNVVGLQASNNLIAQQILLTSTSTTDSTSSQGQVKGDSTTTPSGDKTASSSLEDLLRKSPPDADATSGQYSTKDDSSTAVGSFILEDPSPQFSGN